MFFTEIAETAAWSQAGRIVQHQVTETGQQALMSTYSYDGAGRLVRAVIPGHVLDYGFGPVEGCGQAGHNPRIVATTVRSSQVVSKAVTVTRATAARLRPVANSCRSNSFVPGTLVLMADGTTTPIEDIEVGDLVLATDPETGQSTAQPVIDLITGDGWKDLVRVGTDADMDGVTEWVIATAGHPFYVNDAGWTDAGSLELGDLLVADDGTLIEIVELDAETRLAVVHNLTVDIAHTYYVLIGDDPALVHNCAFGPTSRLFGNTSLGAKRPGLMNNSPKNSGVPALGWSVKRDGDRARAVFRYKSKTGQHYDLYRGRYLR